jgi:hypothetical protein
MSWRKETTITLALASLVASASAAIALCSWIGSLTSLLYNTMHKRVYSQWQSRRIARHKRGNGSTCIIYDFWRSGFLNKCTSMWWAYTPAKQSLRELSAASSLQVSRINRCLRQLTTQQRGRCNNRFRQFRHEYKTNATIPTRIYWNGRREGKIKCAVNAMNYESFHLKRQFLNQAAER